MIHKFRYTSHGKERTVCLVDTPGVMDTRGDVKDEENYHKSIEVIATLKRVIFSLRIIPYTGIFMQFAFF